VGVAARPRNRESSTARGHREIWRSWLASGMDGRNVPFHLGEPRTSLHILRRAARELRSGGRVRTLEMGCELGLDGVLLAVSGASVDAVVSDVVPETISAADARHIPLLELADEIKSKSDKDIQRTNVYHVFLEQR